MSTQFPLSLNGIAYDFYKDGFSCGVGRGRGPWVDAVYDCAWSDAFAFMNALTGVTSVVSNGLVVGWPAPQAYPDSPNVYCFDCSLVGGLNCTGYSPKGGIQFERARIRAEYRVPPFDLLGADAMNSPNGYAQPFISYSKSTSEQQVELPAASLEFEDATLGPLVKNYYMTEPITEIVIERWLLPWLPGETVDNLVGSVNNATFLGYDAGQVKFSHIDTVREVDTGGGTLQHVRIVLERLRRDWDSEWSAVPGKGWGKVWSDPTVQLTPHPRADLSPLLSTAFA